LRLWQHWLGRTLGRGLEQSHLLAPLLLLPLRLLLLLWLLSLLLLLLLLLLFLRLGSRQLLLHQ